MPDHKEMDRQPTEREREIAFAPHESPRRQGDGDPGRKPRPQLIHEDEQESTDEQNDASQRSQADGDTR